MQVWVDWSHPSGDGFCFPFTHHDCFGEHLLKGGMVLFQREDEDMGLQDPLPPVRLQPVVTTWPSCPGAPTSHPPVPLSPGICHPQFQTSFPSFWVQSGDSWGTGFTSTCDQDLEATA